MRNLEKDFALLRDKRFLTVNFNDKAISEAIRTIYGELDPIAYLGSPTAISKILHLLNPEIFVMWDNAIVNDYHKISRHVTYSANGYLEFLKETQKAVLTALSEFEKEIGKSLDAIEGELRGKYGNKTDNQNH